MGIRQRLYLQANEEETLLRHCSDSRFIYHLGLEQRTLWQPDRTAKINASVQMRKLAEAPKAFTWLAVVSSSVQQAALRDLDRAFRNWWCNPKHFSRPTWRKAGVSEGFYIRDLLVRILSRKWGEVLVPKTGWVKFRLTCSFDEIEAANSARITLDSSGRWHLSFTRPAPAIEPQGTEAIVGLDVGGQPSH